MRPSTILLSSLAVTHALVRPDENQAVLGNSVDSDKYLIELGPGETRWISEEDKWSLKRDGIKFMDITDNTDLGSSKVSSAAMRKAVQYPEKPAYNSSIQPLLKKLEKDNMHEHLEKFSSFYTRFYKSEHGRESAAWLIGQVNKTIHDSGAGKYGANVKYFKHPWGQNSIIATIPGKSEKTIVIGAHQDSINMFLPMYLPAPGADDDGSGTVTTLEALRAILESQAIIQGNASNTIEFHWYSAEEGGLLGSQAIFSEYEKIGRDIKAMLQQDMTGYTHKTIAAGEPESVGVITDFVNLDLTKFITKVIDQYCTIPYVLTKCGYACSDHASASKAGYPAAFVIESDFKYSDNKIHTSEDKIKYLDFDHMLQHARMTLALTYELAFAEFE